MDRYAQIIIISKTKAIDNLFTYRIPDNYLGKEIIGLKVLVPFGRGNTVREGFVFSTTDECSYKRIKKIKHFLMHDISITLDDIQLINFIRDEYLCTYTEALQLIVPSGTQLKRKTLYTFKNEDKDLTDKEKNILEFIKKNQTVELAEISKTFKNVSKYLKHLEDNHSIEKKYEFSSVVSEKEKELIFKTINNKEILKIRESIPDSYVAQLRLIDFLLENDKKHEVTRIKKKLSIAKSVIDRIIDMGIAESKTVRDKRHIDHHFDIESDEFKVLNKEQEKAFEEIEPGSVSAWLSPSISQKKYEVSEEVLRALGEKVEDFIESSRPGHFYLDLKSFQKSKLTRLGAITWCNPLCTFEQQEFFSYRQKQGALEARHLAWIELV